MNHADRSGSTCWTVIQQAARGSQEDREEFARRYAPVVRAYLGARWRSSPCLQELDDAVQEIFVECFRSGGVLERVERDRAGGFRAFLYGVVRNIALRVESRRAKKKEFQPSSPSHLDGMERDEETLSRIFDRAWVTSILREAAALQAEEARTSGEEAGRRVELLHLRFHERLPIRDIAQRWDMDADLVHREYAKARAEFKRALREVVAFHYPGTSAEVEGKCEELFSLLG
jgi:RNA polymerase sigma-70 factor (ECF subfamily)